jgi:hypothetical protein
MLGKIGGDSGLTPAGTEYARRLAEFAKTVIGSEQVGVDPDTGTPIKMPRPARLWTSTLRRTKETAHFIEHDVSRCGCMKAGLTFCNYYVVSDLTSFRPLRRYP